jgi:hypothetical protein
VIQLSGYAQLKPLTPVTADCSAGAVSIDAPQFHGLTGPLRKAAIDFAIKLHARENVCSAVTARHDSAHSAAINLDVIYCS